MRSYCILSKYVHREVYPRKNYFFSCTLPFVLNEVRYCVEKVQGNNKGSSKNARKGKKKEIRSKTFLGCCKSRSLNIELKKSFSFLR